jgi:hypothetical protein
MRQGTRLRLFSNPIRPAVTLALAAGTALALGACSDVQGGVDKVRDCATIVEAVSNVNLNPTADPQDLANDVRELERKVNELRHPEVRAAAEALRDDIDRFSNSVRAANPSAARTALGDVRQSAENVARACNVPVDNLLGTS